MRMSRQGACEALGYIKSADALPVLVRLLTHEDRWLRVKAAQGPQEDGRRGETGRPRHAQGGRSRPPSPSSRSSGTIRSSSPTASWRRPCSTDCCEIPSRESIPKLLYPAIRAISRNADGMARATLRDIFENQLTVEDVQALAPDILAAVKTRCPADTMFGNEIRMGGFKALTKYHFKEGIEAGVIFAKTQGGHGSESRTGEIMKEISELWHGRPRSGARAEGADRAIQRRNASKGEFPAGELNDRRVTAVEEAIKAIEAATTQPELRSIAPERPKGSSE